MINKKNLTQVVSKEVYNVKRKYSSIKFLEYFSYYDKISKRGNIMIGIVGLQKHREANDLGVNNLRIDFFED